MRKHKVKPSELTEVIFFLWEKFKRQSLSAACDLDFIMLVLKFLKCLLFLATAKSWAVECRQRIDVVLNPIKVSR